MSGADPTAKWEAEAARYDSAYDDPTGRGRLVHARLETALELLPAGGGSVLDVGMGGGRLCEALVRRGFEVAGADASSAMVELARRRLPSHADSLVQAPIERLPFADGSFDAVVALGVLEYAEDVGAALGELARVLRDGGTAVFSFPCFHGLPSLWRRRLLRPAAQAANVVLGGRLTLRRPRHVLGAADVLRLAAGAGLAVLVLRRLGVRGRPAAPLLAAQLVVRAEKRAYA